MTEEKKLTNAPVEVEDLNEEKVLLEWEAPERSFKKRDKDFWITAISILVLVAVILFFIKEFFLIIALGSILFLYYVMSTVPPENVIIRITNRAVYFGEASYPWTVLEKFWFGTSLNSTTINFGTQLKFPRAISMVIHPKDKEKIKEVVVKRIPMIESSPTLIDKITKYVGNKLPLEDREETKK